VRGGELKTKTILKKFTASLEDLKNRFQFAVRALFSSTHDYMKAKK